MKVIQQLIAYFEARGQLTPKQLRQFVSRGYWGQYTSADLRRLESKIGESFFFQVTGDLRGPLWGTDIYTSDSNLGTACVHAGLLKPGEAGIVKVTMAQPLPSFPGSVRNGATSHAWNTSWSGAYTVAAVAR